MADLLVEIRESDDATVVTRSRAVSLESTRAVDEGGRVVVSVPVNEPAATALTTGRYVHAFVNNTRVNVGLVGEPAERTFVGSEMAAQCSMFDRFADLYRQSAEDSTWTKAAMSGVLGTAAGTPPGLLYNTGWSLDIAADCGTILVTQAAQGEKLADLLKKVVSDAELGGTPLHWWADAITKTVHVGRFGSDSTLLLANSDAPSPTGALPVVTISDLTEQSTGEIVNRIDCYGGSTGGNRLELMGTETGGAYTCQKRATRMGASIVYLEDAASTAAYGLWAADYNDNTVDNEELGAAEARDQLYKGGCAYLARNAAPHQAWQVEARGTALRGLDPGESCRLWFYRKYYNVLETTGATIEATHSLNRTAYATKISRHVDATGERFSIELGSTLDHKIGSTGPETIGKALAAAARQAGSRTTTRMVTSGGVPSSGAAPANATFITISAESGLSAETTHATVAAGDRHNPKSHTHAGTADADGGALGTALYVLPTKELRITDADEGGTGVANIAVTIGTVTGYIQVVAAP